MPSTANIVVADATPTNHTFKPLSASLALSTWAEFDATIYEGNARLSIALSNPTATRKTSRLKQVLSYPFERTVDGIVTVPDTILYTVEAVLPSACSAAEALEAYTVFKNLWANTLVQSYFASREPVY